MFNNVELAGLLEQLAGVLLNNVAEVLEQREVCVAFERAPQTPTAGKFAVSTFNGEF